ncbi:MAG: hypothetical protein ACJ72E_13495 [Marmoricola sp.]
MQAEPEVSPVPGERARWTGLAVAAALVAAAMAIPPALDWNVHINTFPPIYADWEPRVGPGTAPAILIALLGTLYAARLARSLSWGRLLIATWALGVAWMLALATVDGTGGISHILNSYNEYLRTARATHDLHHTLQIYVSRIPFDSPDNWPAHLAGHPPGALTFFVVLVRLGLGSGFAAGMVITLIAATTALAVMTTLRALGAEELARTAAPFLVLGPVAITQCVSADAMFAAVAAWGMATLALAATRTSTRAMLAYSVLSGVLLGYTVMLSYGLPLLALLALVVLGLAGSFKPLLPAAVAALAVMLLYAALGFNWLDAFHTLHNRYWDGVAHKRPGIYWNWADLSALLCCTGLLAGAGVAQVAVRRHDTDPQVRVVTRLAATGVLMVLLADASQMSRAEVERIWLPFAPWILLGCALLPERWRRWGLALQVLSALVLVHLLHEAW